MKTILYDTGAKRQTVSVTLNSDLCSKAKAEGLNLSRIAEQAIADALRASQRERIRQEIEAEIAEHNRFLAENTDAVEAWRSYGLSED